MSCFFFFVFFFDDENNNNNDRSFPSVVCFRRTRRPNARINKTFEKILSVLQAHSARRLSVAAECRTLVSNASCTGGGVLSTMASSTTETKTKDEEDDESSSYPVGSFAAFAIEEEDADGDESVTTPSTAGLPIFALSQLSSHTRDL